MLRKRVIPIVLLDGYSVVKTIQFSERRNLGNPITVARIYNSRDVDELLLLDIDASKEQRQIDIYTIEDIASECFMPLTVGGGIMSCCDIENVLARGADKVVINTLFFKNPSIVKDAVRLFGSQCIVASVDIKYSGKQPMLYSHAGAEVQTSLSEHMKLLEGLGVGEIIVNSVDRDGTMLGYNTETIEYISNAISVPVVAAGGAGSAKDCVKAIQAGASAVSAASMYHFTSITPLLCKKAMAEAGIPARL